MGGILVPGKPEGVEATGVFQGVLVEDMIDTVNRVKKPYIDVFISSVFFKDADYPLTYVPTLNMVLPLKKDQKVWVYFNQTNHRYPVLWKLVDDLDTNFAGKMELPSDGDLFSFPAVADTKEVVKFSDDCWFIGTKEYGVFRWGDQCVLLSGDKIITNSSGSLHFKAASGVTIEAKGKVTLSGGSFDLGTVLSDVFEALADPSVPTTTGTPAAQYFNPKILTALNFAKSQLGIGFKR